jgi:hypothetical protein
VLHPYLKITLFVRAYVEDLIDLLEAIVFSVRVNHEAGEALL